jgi:polar amino acid transport system substrate-binding protein
MARYVIVSALSLRLCLGACLLLAGFSAQADTLRLTSLHWPPYSSQKMVNQGASVAVLRASLRAMGHELDVDFYPWSRAVKLAGNPQSKYAGYFPEYYFETSKFVFSDPMGTSPLGLLESKSRPISWAELRDLRSYNLGVVQDYVNTAELDEMIANGSQRVEVVTSDEFNIRKVAAARIDAAVIDVYVMHYLLNQKHLQPLADKLQMNRKLLENKVLYVAFKNSPEGKKWRDIVNQGLGKIDVEKVLADNLQENVR